jgi:tagatose 6-phosphate kinase
VVSAVGIVAGRAGDWIVERLAELGIADRMARSAGETRTCVSVLDRASGTLTEFYERGMTIDAIAWEALETIIREELELGDIAAVALSGSLPQGAPDDGYGRIARMAGASVPQVPILADAYGPALAAVLAERPAVVKVNATEAGEASGVEVTDASSAIEATRVLRDAGAACVVVTLDAGGAVVASAAEQAHLIPPAIRGSYPVGSGDAFLGGLAVASERGESIVDAARLGLAAGIANAQIPGAGNLDPAFVEGVLDQIGVARLPSQPPE